MLLSSAKGFFDSVGCGKMLTSLLSFRQALAGCNHTSPTMKELIKDLLERESRKEGANCLCASPIQATSATAIALVILASGKKTEDFKDEEGKKILHRELENGYMWTKCYKVPYVTEKISNFLGL